MGVPPGFPRSGDPYQAQGGPQAPEPQRGGFGGSFLGTAAAAAAGVIGGTLLMNALKGAFGGQQSQAQSLGEFAGQTQSNPWGDAAGGGDLARQAGIDHIGRPAGDRERASLFDQGHEPVDEAAMMPDDEGGFDLDFDSDFT
jgi:hypothetical protein